MPSNIGVCALGIGDTRGKYDDGVEYELDS
jgi:hypothetical protein